MSGTVYDFVGGPLDGERHDLAAKHRCACGCEGAMIVQVRVVGGWYVANHEAMQMIYEAAE